MRSHPYAPPPPLPQLLDELAQILPNQDHHRAASEDGDIPLDTLDPDTSKLLPARKKRHQVRVQGRLALVRSISTANLPATSSPREPGSTRFDPAVGSTVSPKRRGRHHRRGSLDERRRRLSAESESESEEDSRETVRRDRQLRGYGIGGVGNIRRPTDVADFSSNRMSSMPLFAGRSASKSGVEKTRWNLLTFLGKRGDRKGKAPATMQ